MVSFPIKSHLLYTNETPPPSNIQTSLLKSPPPNDSPFVPFTAYHIYEPSRFGPLPRSTASVSPCVFSPKKVIPSNYVLVAHDGVDMINTNIRLSNRVEDARNGQAFITANIRLCHDAPGSFVFDALTRRSLKIDP